MEGEGNYDSNYYSANSQDRDRPALIYYNRLIKRYLREGTCLDFGCGTGHLLRRISAHRPAIGIESSEWALSAASRNAPDAKVYASLAEVPDGSCSSIVSIHAVEHITDAELDELLREFRRVMVGNGRLLVVTPDAGGWPAKAKGERWIAYTDPTHINLKSHRAWAAFFEARGLRVLKEGADGLYDFPYSHGRHPKVDVLLRGWPTLAQYVAGRLVLKPGRGESSIFVLEAQGS